MKQTDITGLGETQATQRNRTGRQGTRECGRGDKPQRPDGRTISGEGYSASSLLQRVNQMTRNEVY